MLSVIVAGVETNLSGGDLCTLVAYDGWGMPPQHRLSSRGSKQHGDTDEGFRLDPRFGKLTFQINASSLYEMYNKRDTILNLFSPENDSILKWALPNGQIRHIKGFYYGDLALGWDRDAWAAQRFEVTVKCNDPTFYDPAGNAVTFGLGSGGGAFTVPMPVPHGVGASDIDQSNVITYSGNWRAYPQIRIYGPITNCVITNESTGERLDFAGITIPNGDWYDIDCRYPYKTVIDSLGANKIDNLTDNSDLSTFRIASTREVPGGINSIRVTGSGVSTATKIDIVYFERYLGV